MKRIAVLLLLCALFGTAAALYPADRTRAILPEQDGAAAIPVGAMPAAMALDEELNRLYVVNFGSGTVSVIDTRTNRVTAEIGAGASPSGILIHPAQNKIYVNNQGSDTITVINRQTLTVEAETAVGSQPWAMALSPSGATLYVLNHKTGSVTALDAAALNVTAVYAVGQRPTALIVNEQGMLYTANTASHTVSIINPATGEIKETRVGQSPARIVYNPVNKLLYVGHNNEKTVVILTETGKYVERLYVDAGYALQFDPESGQVYIGGEAWKLYVVDSQNRLVRLIPLPFTPGSVTLDKEQETLYIPNWGQDAVFAVNLTTNDTALIPVGPDPSSVLIDYAHNQLYVNNTDYPADGRPRPSSLSIIPREAPFAAEDKLTFAGGGGGRRWNQFCVNCPRFAAGLQERSLVTDNAGRPRLAYGADAVYYAWHDGVQWHTEVAADSGAGGHVSLALDSRERPYISFWQDSDDSLRLAYRNDAGEWQIAIVDNTGYVGQYSSIAIDGQDRVHIAYYDFGVGRLKYARQLANGWEIQTIDGYGGVGWAASLALDSGGIPRVSYYDNINKTLKYAWLSGGLWQIEVISGETSYYSSLVIDQSDNVFVSYVYLYDAPYRKLMFGRRAAGGWQVETAVSDLNLAPQTTLKIDAAGRPHIAWYDDNASDSGAPNQVQYAMREGSVWTTETVDAALAEEFPALALDASGQPYIAWYEPASPWWVKGTGRLQAARRLNNIWTVETVDTAGRGGEQPSLIVNNQGNPRLIYVSYFPPANSLGQSITGGGGSGGNSQKNLVYARWTGNNWATEHIGAVGNYFGPPSLAVDDSGNPRVVYDNAGAVIYARPVNNTWITETIAAGYGGIAAVDSGSRLHAAFIGAYPDTFVYHAVQNGSSWKIDRLPDQPSSLYGFALDDQDRPHLLYGGYSHVNASYYVEYARWNGLGWTRYGWYSGAYTRPAFALGPSGGPHISYCGASGLTYTTLQNGVWQTTPINADSCLTDTAINVNSAGNPAIAFVDADTYQLRYAYRANNVWGIELPAEETAVGQSWQDPALDLEFDSSDRPYITYYDSTNQDLKLATPQTSLGGSTLYLPVIVKPPILISSVLTPFDANASDLTGPSGWGSNYGKRPEIIAVSDGVALDVLAQDYNTATSWNAVLLHIEPSTSGYAVTQALTNMPMLDRVMGLDADDAGSRYYAVGVDESDVVNSAYPPLDTYRSNIVRVVKLNATGDVQYNIDLDTARHAKDNNAEMIINPMTAASSRLAVGGGEIALVHGINTAPDWNIGGARHQKALSTRLNAVDGSVTRVSSVWVSHSFDQRLFYDGSGMIEHHLGDAFPRYIVFGRDHVSYPLFHIKGDLGENNTRTRLGNIALIENDPVYGYIVLFASESSAATGSIVNGPRNLAVVRVNRSDNSIDPGLPNTLTVNSKGVQQTNRLKWLTHYSAESQLHAERPKLVGIGGDRYIVLWEEWRNDGSYSDTFNGVFGMVIDAQGNIIRPASLLTTGHHLHRGDDAVFLNGRAAWVTGNAAQRKLYIHMVDSSLNYEIITLD